MKSKDSQKSAEAISEEESKRVRSLLDRAAALVKEKAEGNAGSLDERLKVLGTYLEELGDIKGIAPDLADAQQRYWPLHREYVVGTLGGIIRKRRAVASPPTATLTELVNKLRDTAQKVATV